MGDFVLREIANGMDVVAYMRDLEDPTEDFVKRFLPEDLTNLERNNHVKKDFLSRSLKNMLTENIRCMITK